VAALGILAAASAAVIDAMTRVRRAVVASVWALQERAADRSARVMAMGMDGVGFEAGTIAFRRIEPCIDSTQRDAHERSAGSVPPAAASSRYNFQPFSFVSDSSSA